MESVVIDREVPVPAADLEKRIASCFADGVSSADIANLIAEVETESAAQDEAAKLAREQALDPIMAGEAVKALRRRMEDVVFQRDRLQAALPKLQERLRDVRAQEEDARRKVAYEAAQAERDKLAEEIARVYPPIAVQLADLMARIDANDREIEHINAGALPDDAKPLAVAELAARGLRGFREDGLHDVPRITKQLRLPAYTFDKFDPFTWPRPQ